MQVILFKTLNLNKFKGKKNQSKVDVIFIIRWIVGNNRRYKGNYRFHFPYLAKDGK